MGLVWWVLQLRKHPRMAVLMPAWVPAAGVASNPLRHVYKEN